MHCRSTIPLGHAAWAAVDFILKLNCSHSSQGSSLLNSAPLSDNMVFGVPKMAIQFFIKASAISSFSLDFTAAAAMNQVPWSTMCKI